MSQPFKYLQVIRLFDGSAFCMVTYKFFYGAHTKIFNMVFFRRFFNLLFSVSLSVIKTKENVDERRPRSGQVDGRVT